MPRNPARTTLISTLLATVTGAVLLATPIDEAAAQGANPQVLMKTSLGEIVIELYPEIAPRHVERIKTLAREKFYDGIKFHRVIDGFMAQTGCPQGRGTGSSSYPNLPAEFNAEPHVRGVCSMARSSMPNSANLPT